LIGFKTDLKLNDETSGLLKWLELVFNETLKEEHGGLMLIEDIGDVQSYSPRL